MDPNHESDPDATIVNPSAGVAWRDPVATPPGPTPPAADGPRGPSDGEERKWRTAFLALIAVIVAIIVIIVVIVIMGGRDTDNGSTTTSTVPTTTAPSSTTGPSSTTAATTQPPTTTAATTTSASAAPAIATFTAAPNPAPCPATVAVNLVWTTSNATGVTIAIDGPGIYGSYPASGNASVPFNCDGEAHTYTLTANGGGPSVTQTLTVKPAN